MQNEFCIIRVLVGTGCLLLRSYSEWAPDGDHKEIYTPLPMGRAGSGPFLGILNLPVVVVEKKPRDDDACVVLESKPWPGRNAAPNPLKAKLAKRDAGLKRTGIALLDDPIALHHLAGFFSRAVELYGPNFGADLRLTEADIAALKKPDDLQ